MSNRDVYTDKTVFVTGHTGFKGSWLCEWLMLRGARVVGCALDPDTDPAHADAIGLGERLEADYREDIRDAERMGERIRAHRPDFVFHLAAQPLVRRSFREPSYTFETNVMGSLNVLEAVRGLDRDCVVVMVTTDKVYENREWVHAYRECDALGGYDPYSASKACAEHVVGSYRQSFFNAADTENRIFVASARGGNVIGGGDWSEDRIVPDCVKSLRAGRSIPVRNKHATRPWQHVLELLSGYLRLGAEIHRARSSGDGARLASLCGPFNFGPNLASNRSVADLVREILGHWPGAWEDLSDPEAPHEAGRLNLTIDKAHHVLGWQPRWSFAETIRHTVAWYRAFYENPAEAGALTRRQIQAYAEGGVDG